MITTEAVIVRLKEHLLQNGYRLEVSPDGTEERWIRPDGTVAIVARRVANSELSTITKPASAEPQ